MATFEQLFSMLKSCNKQDIELIVGIINSGNYNLTDDEFNTILYFLPSKLYVKVEKRPKRGYKMLSDVQERDVETLYNAYALKTKLIDLYGI